MINYFSVPGMIITISNAQQLMKEHNGVTLHLEVRDIIRLVCDEYGVTLERSKEKTRKREVVTARQVSMYFIRNYTKHSLSSIGSMFNQDHSTAIHANNNVNNLCDTDSKYRRTVNNIEQRLIQKSKDNMHKGLKLIN